MELYRTLSQNPDSTGSLSEMADYLRAGNDTLPSRLAVLQEYFNLFPSSNLEEAERNFRCLIDAREKFADGDPDILAHFDPMFIEETWKDGRRVLSKGNCDLALQVDI